MAEFKVVYTKFAIQNRKQILQFWITNNGNKRFSIKLEKQFKDATNLLNDHPLIGTKTNKPNVRYLLVRYYRLYYTVQGNIISIITIWDNRRNPDSVKI